jgi:hypothetical protein
VGGVGALDALFGKDGVSLGGTNILSGRESEDVSIEGNLMRSAASSGSMLVRELYTFVGPHAPPAGTLRSWGRPPVADRAGIPAVKP